MTRFRIAAILVLALVVAVGVARADARRVTSPCVPTVPETCLYTSDLSYTPGVVDGIVLVDPARGGYRIPLLVRYPIEATDPRPVVIWNHGGNPSEIGRTRSAEWGETLARAGYVVVHPSRVLPDDVTPLLPECTANGFPEPTTCAGWIAQMRYPAQTTHFLIDRLAALATARPVLAGRLDTTRVVVAGHSAGTTTVLANAGALQQWNGGAVYDEEDTRPLAFLATAPQGPTYAGFHSGFDEERSFVDVERPFLFVTGRGDETGEPVPTRLTAWITSQPGDKLLVWDTDPHAVHETMDIDKCDTPVRADHCRWIASAGLAYLDGVVRGRNAARQWLGSDAFAAATGGAVELHRR